MPRFTIERLRTLVLVGGLLLVAAIGAFLAAGKWKRQFLTKDLPKRLGVDIQQQADGVDYTQSRKGKTLFKIHAARAVQLKKDGKTLLHDVRIDLYGEDGKAADTIRGSEFEYDPGAGIAQAAGVVEITLMRPGEKPAIAQLKPGKPVEMPKVPSALGEITDSQIHVKTSGLVFDQKSGQATTSQRVDFAVRQGSGSSVGAVFDSDKGQLVLDHAVELHMNRTGAAGLSEPVTLHAGHAEFERKDQFARLTQARAEYSGGTADAALALVHFRDDGSLVRLDGSGGVALITAAGSHLAAPRGTLDFDENNHPRHGLLEGGAQLDSSTTGRQMHGSAPTAKLTFDTAGQLRLAHLEQGVQFESLTQATAAQGKATQSKRTWHSQTADIEFAASTAKRTSSTEAAGKKQPKAEARTIRGFGGVVITSETIGGPASDTGRLAADSIVAELAPGAILSTLTGTGHASFDQQTAAGAHQSSTSDQLVIHMAPSTGKSPAGTKGANAEIASILQTGHVQFTQNSPPDSPTRPGHAAEPGVRATADRADYDGPSQMLHLSGSPRVQNGTLDLAATRIDFARATGDAFAHGDVKASWSGSSAKGETLPGSTLLGGGAGSRGPVHAIAAEAELRKSTGEVLFRGTGTGAPRLWQGANSIAAPVILLNRLKQTLVATSTTAATPVRTVLIRTTPEKPAEKSKSATPSVIRLRSGELRYSEGERLALLKAGSAATVTAETTGQDGAATVNAQEAEIRLLPAGVHSGASGSSGNTSVDQMTARGHVVVDWPGRRGTGEKLVYQSEDGNFTLTGSSAVRPRITDQLRGTVTGNALIFHSRDDSVTVEGDGTKTVTETQSPK